MLLFVGLGNPGAKYAGNRHNIGFMVVDAIAKRHGFPPWRRRFQGVATEGCIAGKKALRSISAHVGNDYKRVRIGVGHPGVKELVHPHVLSDFAKDERPWVEALTDVIAANADLLAAGKDASFQNKVHLAM